MPKVTLLAGEWGNYTLAFGKGLFEFRGGSPMDVPVAVALEAAKRISKGKPLFKVEGLPKIVEGLGKDAGDITPESDLVQQNVATKGEKTRRLVQQQGLFSEE